MGCVLQFVELVGYLGRDVKETGLQGCFMSHFLGNLSGCVLVIISLDKGNVYHDTIQIKRIINTQQHNAEKWGSTKCFPTEVRHEDASYLILSRNLVILHTVTVKI